MELTSNQVDHRIIRELRQRNKQALTELYDTYAAPLYGCILRWVDNEQVASEVLRKVFVEVWANCDTEDCMKQKVFTWMYGISKKIALKTESFSHT